MDDKKKVFVIEDDDTVSNLVETLLVHHGYDVRLFHNGTKVVEAAEKENPDIILLDIMLPDRDGFQLCQSFKSRKATSHIPVIVMTALNRVEDQEKALNYGANDFIGKPFESERLLKKVERLLPPQPQ